MYFLGGTKVAGKMTLHIQKSRSRKFYEIGVFQVMIPKDEKTNVVTFLLYCPTFRHENEL